MQELLGGMQQKRPKVANHNMSSLHHCGDHLYDTQANLSTISIVKLELIHYIHSVTALHQLKSVVN